MTWRAICHVCSGRKVLYAGNGVSVPCTACGGADKVTATVGEALAAKRPMGEPPSVLTFVVEGEPVGKERPQVFRNRLKDGRVITRGVTPDKTREYEAKVKLLAEVAARQARWAWSEKDVFTILLRIYTTHLHAHPDASNVLKAVEDACNRVLWRDDRYVRRIEVVMMPPDPKRPRVEIEVRRHRVAEAR